MTCPVTVCVKKALTGADPEAVKVGILALQAKWAGPQRKNRMANEPQELSANQALVHQRASLITRRQLSEATELFATVSAGKPNPDQVLAMAQLLATNYLAMATMRIAPKK